jgi:alpha-beta hydrolase superfamily lysophospholipase
MGRGDPVSPDMRCFVVKEAAMPEWKEDFFSPDAKHRMFYRTCFPEKSRGLVFILHGYGEHSGRYRHVMEYLAAYGYASCAPDHRGHGRSARHLGDLESFDRILEDLALFKDVILTGVRPSRLFILGHSMGGCLALCLSARHSRSVTGTVAIAPMILIPPYASPVLIAVSSVMAALAPRLPAQAFPVEYTCRDPQVLEASQRDPCCYNGKMMVRTGSQMLYGIKKARSVLHEISLPLLLLHGGDDQVMNVDGSRHVLAEVGSRDKELKIYEKLYHEILNEPEKDRPLADILAWLDAHHDTPA